MRLLGARSVNYRAALPSRFALGGRSYELTCYPRSLRVEAALDGAEAAAVDEDGLAVVITRRLGKGRVIAVLPQVEETIAAYSWDRQRRDAWIEFYRLIWEI
jgi:type 1 glutamine amidotransferase